MTADETTKTTAPPSPERGALFIVPWGVGLGLMFISAPPGDFLLGVGFLTALISAVLFSIAHGKALKPFRSIPCEILLGLYILLAALSVTAAKDPRLALTALAEIIIGTLSFYLVLLYLQVRKEYQKVFYSLLLLPAAYVVLLGLLQIVTGDYSISMGFKLEDGLYATRGRASSIFSSPNIFAAYLIAVLPLALVSVLSKALKSYERAAIIFLGLAGLLCLVFTFSRNGWLSVVISALIMSLVTGSKKMRYAALLFCAALFIGALLFYCLKPQALRNYAFHGSADERRVLIYRTSAAMIRDHWLLGIGAGNFRMVYPSYLSHEEIERYREPLPWHAHSLGLNMAIETGIPGTIAFLLFIGVVLRDLFRARIDDFESRLLYIGSLWGITSMLTVNVLDCLMNDHKCGFFFFLLLGFCLALVKSATISSTNEAQAAD
jgi:putative inorganic carbon (hco3(-)) transporter